MSNFTPNHTALHSLSPDEWIARREESIERIGAVLAEGARTIADIAAQFGVPEGTTYGHLAYMEKQGLAHRTGRRDAHRRGLWAAGTKPSGSGQPAEQDEADDLGPRTVPARQIGMFRHWMDVALFGPAQGAAA